MEEDDDMDKYVDNDDVHIDHLIEVVNIACSSTADV